MLHPCQHPSSCHPSTLPSVHPSPVHPPPVHPSNNQYINFVLFNLKSKYCMLATSILPACLLSRSILPAFFLRPPFSNIHNIYTFNLKSRGCILANIHPTSMHPSSVHSSCVLSASTLFNISKNIYFQFEICMLHPCQHPSFPRPPFPTFKIYILLI